MLKNRAAAIYLFALPIIAACLVMLNIPAVAAGTDSPEKWFDTITPETKMIIAGVALVAIALLITFISTRRYRIPTSAEAKFTLEKYEQDLKRRINELKMELTSISESYSPERLKITAALKEAEQRLNFIESGYEKAVNGMTGLAGELEVLRGWVSETEIESAESMLVSGKTEEARAIWARIATESGIRKEAYARREADAWFHLALLARADLDYEAAMDAFIRSIETGKAGIAHIAEAANMALKIKDYHNAEGLYKEALSMAVDCDECTKNTIRNCQTGLADVYVHSGKYAEALPLYKTALATVIEVYGEQSTPTADTYLKVARWHKEQGQEAEAAEFCRKAMNIYTLLLPGQNPRVVAAREMCGD
ncbi:tetratricopeptide repeat protein [Maridesulfovibrio sp. FT414]|uniref:tetratricopeptide repeat protein n=1 Tax=Maridesulfovibrio sp. FT414 TaxID=2979469 RepID=UPI003D8065A0